MSVESSELERNLGFLEAMTLGGGTMIGAGIFILPGLAAEGAGPASAVSFAVAGFVALLAALSLSELATGMPIAGGSYHYVNRALGGLFGSVVGWGMWTGLMFASAFYMIGFGQYIVVPLGFLSGRPLVVLVGLAGLGLIVGINYYGTDESSGAQNVMIGVEFAIVLVYLGLGVFFVDPGNLTPFAPTGPEGILATTGTVFVTYLGFEIIATVAGEIEDPGRLIPLTMVLSVVAVTLLYVVVMLVTTGVVPYGQLGASLVPVSDVAQITMFGAVGVAAITFAAAIAAISSSNSSVLAASRVVFAMGRDGLLSERLNVTHDRFATPHRAILATGGVTALLVLAGLQVEAIVALLAQVASFTFLVTYALVHVSVVTFRRADPDDYEPAFRLDRSYPIVPILGVVMTVVVVSQMRPAVIVVGSGVVLFGVVWYAAYARGPSLETGSGMIEEAFGDLPAATLDRLRPTAGAGEDRGEPTPYRVVVPVANPDTQRGLIRLAAATARAHADEGIPELVAVNVVEADPSPEVNVASERLDSQRELLETAGEIATTVGVELRTRSLVRPDAGEAILEAVEDADAEQVVMGWEGRLTRAEYVFGPTLDPVIERAPCDVSAVQIRTESVGQPVALTGPGPHAPVAARRAVDFATVEGTTPVLLNVQPPTHRDPVGRGEAAVERVAERAGLEPDQYESRVVVDEEIETAILETVTDYDTVCAGLSERSRASRLRFGSITERISRESTGNVAIVRGESFTDEATRRESAPVSADAGEVS